MCASRRPIRRSRTPASKGQVLRLPIAHGEGSYFAEPKVIEQLKRQDRILFGTATAAGKVTDAANPNGSLDNIAGICNENRNVFGLMPHPERASEKLLGSDDGRVILESALRHDDPRGAVNCLGGEQAA